eukprot:4995432-Prymnesium_polylepis.1
MLLGATVAEGGKLPLEHVREVIIDEADACEGQAADAMGALLHTFGEARAELPPPQTVLAGASLSYSLVRHAEELGWVRRPLL